MPAVAADIMQGVLRAVFTPRERPSPDLWCDQHRVLPARSAERPGRWDTARTPYFREPFRVFLDPHVRRMTMLKSAQIGASEWGIGLILYTLAVQHHNAIVVYPREEEARRFLTKRIRPAIELCRAFDDLRTGRAHDEKTTELILKSASLAVKWAHAGGGVKSDPCPKVFGDEADDYPPGVSDQLESRTTTFVEAKVVEWSTPSLEEIGIDARYLQSDQRQFWVPCPHSGRYFELYDFSLIRWEGGLEVTPEQVERSAYVQSPFVHGRAGRIYEHHKPAMIADGIWVRRGESVEGALDRGTQRWQRNAEDAEKSSEQGIEQGIEPEKNSAPSAPLGDLCVPLSSIDSEQLRAGVVRGVRITGEAERPDARHVGFRLNSLVSPWITWGKIAAEFVERRGEPDAKWINDRLGQPWRAPGQRVEANELRGLATPIGQGGYATNTVPDGCLVLVTVIDVQADHAWAGVYGFGEQAHDVYFIGHRRIPAPEGNNLAELDTVHGFEFAMLGTRMRPAMVGIDYGHRPKEVARFAARAAAARRRVLMCKGDGTAERHWLVKQGQTQSGSPLLFSNVNALKDWAAALMSPRIQVHSAIDDQVQPGRLHLPGDVDAEVLRQLTSEQRVTVDARGKALRRGGRIVSEWRLKPGRRDNHLFDLLVMALALAEAHGFEGLKAQHVHEVRAGQTGRRSAIKGVGEHRS